MKKFLGSVFLALMLFAGNVMAQDVTIAVVPKGLDNPVFTPARKGAEAEGEKLGVKVLWVGPAETDTAGQVVVIKSLIAKKVSAIAVSANDANALNDVIAEAVNAGIIVSTWDSDAKTSKRTFYIGPDNYNNGLQSGEVMKSLLGSNKKVYCLSGGPNAANLNARIQGFKDAVKANNIEIVEVGYCNDNADQAAGLIEMYLKSNPGIDGIFMAGGWPMRVKDPSILSNLKKFTGPVVACAYYPGVSAPFLKEGVVDVCIGADFYNMGVLSVRQLADIVKNKTSYPEVTDSGTFRVDKSNVDQY